MTSAGFLLLAVVLLPWPAQAQDESSCASSVSGLRRLIGNDAFPLKWVETTMDDGKPLVVSIIDKGGVISLEFVKTGEGLWAESTGTICMAGDTLEARFSRDDIRLGPAANLLLRIALGGGGRFTLSRPASQYLRVTTTGWSGLFVPHVGPGGSPQRSSSIAARLPGLAKR